MHKQSYFGIASILLELDSLVIFGLFVITNNAPSANFLLSSVPSFLVNAALQGYFPIAGAVAAIIGLVVDQKKVFSILGLALLLMVLILIFIYTSR